MLKSMNMQVLFVLFVIVLAGGMSAPIEADACGKDSAWTGVEKRKVNNFIEAVQEQFNKALQLEGTSQGAEEMEKLKDMLESADEFKKEVKAAELRGDQEAKRNYRKAGRKLKKISNQVATEPTVDVSSLEARLDDLQDKLDQELGDVKQPGEPGFDEQQARLAQLEAEIDAAGMAMIAGQTFTATSPEAEKAVNAALDGVAEQLTDLKTKVSALTGSASGG